MLFRLLLVSSILLVSCGKKGTPSAPDRFAPSLDELRVLDRNHLELDFSEDVDTLLLSIEDFLVANPDRETLTVYGVYPLFNNAQVVLATARQDSILYSLTGTVRDANGNVAEIDEQFMGCQVIDSIPPRVIDYPATVKSKKISFKFSEAMDTAALRYAFAPKNPKGFVSRWDKGLRRIDLYPVSERDSLAAGTIYYLLIYRASDIARNTMKQFCTYFTPDSLLPKSILRGRVYAGDSLIDAALIIGREKDRIVAMAISDKGQFSLFVKESIEYKIEAFFDDRYAQRSARVGDTLVLRLAGSKTPPYEDIFK